MSKDWGWIKDHMPRTVAMLAEYRAAGEGAHIDECWRRGVVRGEANWFCAVEGPLTLGTAFDARPRGSVLGEMEQWEFASSKTLLQLAPLPDGPLVVVSAKAKAARAITGGQP